MTTEWFVAKYIPDLRRREPRNIGVILVVDGVAHHKFVGDHSDRPLGVEGRNVAKMVASTENYKAWVEHWRIAADEQRVTDLLAKRTTDNYYVERGGFMLAGDAGSPGQILGRLFAMLVDEVPTEKQTKEDPWAGTRHAFGEVQSRGFEVMSNAEIEVECDRLFFHFDVRRNGARALFRLLKLNSDSSKTWRAVHETIYSIEAAAKIAPSFALIMEHDAGEQVPAQKTVIKAKLRPDAAIFLDSDPEALIGQIMPKLAV